MLQCISETVAADKSRARGEGGGSSRGCRSRLTDAGRATTGGAGQHRATTILVYRGSPVQGPLPI